MKERSCGRRFVRSRLVVDDRRGRDAPLSLAEDQQRLGANAVMLHRVDRGLGLHELLVGGQVGDRL
jgi:hypothetical protein